MCYFISGYINAEAYNDDFIRLCNTYKKGYEIIINQNVFSQISNKDYRYFSISTGICDCDTVIGYNVTGKTRRISDKEREIELNNYLEFIKELQTCRKIKYFGLLKHFYKGSFDDENIEIIKTVTIHIDDIEVSDLANVLEDILYKIMYFKRI